MLCLLCMLSYSRASRLTSALQNGNHIGIEGVKAIAQALIHNSSVETLFLVRFDPFFWLCYACLIVLCSFSARWLIVESQNDNGIGDEGAKAIAQALTQNSRLGTVYLVRFVLCFLCCFCSARSVVFVCEG
jgi:hypothetical protein